MPARAQWEQTNWLGRQQYSSNTGSGSLRIELAGYGGREGRTFRWTDGKHGTLDDKLPDVLAEVEIRAAEDAHRDRERQRQEDEQRRRRERAIERATAELVEDERARHLLDQVKRWRRAGQAREYLAAMRATIEARAAAAPTDDELGEHERDLGAAREWLAWAELYVGGMDPLSAPLRMPTPPDPTPEALRPYLHRYDR